MFDYFDLGLFVYLSEEEEKEKEKENADTIRSTDSDTVKKENGPGTKKTSD